MQAPLMQAMGARPPWHLHTISQTWGIHESGKVIEFEYQMLGVCDKLCNEMLWCAVRGYVTLCAILLYTMPCYAVQRCAMLCCTTLCYTMSIYNQSGPPSINFDILQDVKSCAHHVNLQSKCWHVSTCQILHTPHQFAFIMPFQTSIYSESGTPMHLRAFRQTHQP